MAEMSGEAPGVEVLAMNAGSSSIKFALFRADPSLGPRLEGAIEGIGSGAATLSYDDGEGQQQKKAEIPDHRSAASFLIDWMEDRIGFDSIAAVGHRIVHGMGHMDPERLTPDLLRELHGIESYDPDHLPRELTLVEALLDHRPDLVQIACFDTAFHRDLPRAAALLPLPRRYEEKGLRRYGFHGLSYEYLMGELAGISEEEAGGRVILAHLGSGASLAAVRHGLSLDTSMGFTPTAGLVMGTRPGDLDPGIAWYLLQVEGLSPAEYRDLINHESGLLGISGSSSDMKELLERQHRDEGAAEAVEFFCYQARKWIGAFAAALEGLDTVVFAGGIGERSAEIRSRICKGLDFLGIHLDDARNGAHAALISPDAAPVSVRVIPTNEELMIAKIVLWFLRGGGGRPDGILPGRGPSATPDGQAR